MGAVVAGGIVALLIALAGVIVFLREKRQLQSAKPATPSGMIARPDQARSSFLEMHGDSRPIELPDVALQELNGQSLLELDQTGSPRELDADKPSGRQIKKDCCGAEILR